MKVIQKHEQMLRTFDTMKSKEFFLFAGHLCIGLEDYGAYDFVNEVFYEIDGDELVLPVSKDRITITID